MYRPSNSVPKEEVHFNKKVEDSLYEKRQLFFADNLNGKKNVNKKVNVTLTEIAISTNAHSRARGCFLL